MRNWRDKSVEKVESKSWEKIERSKFEFEIRERKLCKKVETKNRVKLDMENIDKKSEKSEKVE